MHTYIIISFFFFSVPSLSYFSPSRQSRNYSAISQKSFSRELCQCSDLPWKVTWPSLIFCRTFLCLASRPTPAGSNAASSWGNKAHSSAQPPKPQRVTMAPETLPAACGYCWAAPASDSLVCSFRRSPRCCAPAARGRCRRQPRPRAPRGARSGAEGGAGYPVRGTPAQASSALRGREAAAARRWYCRVFVGGGTGDGIGGLQRLS